MTNTKDFLPAVQQTLKPILEKIKNSSGAGQSAGDGSSSAPVKKAPVVKEEEEEKAPVVKEEEEEKAPVKNSFAKKAEE